MLTSRFSTSGCVVYGRVSGDTAAAYVLQNAKAADRLGAVAGHLIETKVKVDPSSSKVSIEFSWAGEEGSSARSGPSSSSPAEIPASAKSTEPAGVSSSTQEAQGKTEAKENKKGGEFTMEEVAKHTSDKDIWVVVEDQVCSLFCSTVTRLCFSLGGTVGS